MNRQNKKMMIGATKWIGQYLLVALVSVFAFYGARAYVGTEYEILQSNIQKTQLNQIVSMIESENVPYILSVDKKRIRVPSYTVPRLQHKLSQLLTGVSTQGGF